MKKRDLIDNIREMKTQSKYKNKNPATKFTGPKS